ncbi:4-hydroxybenzoate polyprenyltransferase [Anaerosporobacter mobilis DSM 15930]|uniref:4-hydroxybenzoate polyprenyltransferase n=1 Tax=Anaerosporobacter mobilis DSM 15930 TaxID=1120996 RepID=A0A1M7MJF3_9FIRM|nr:UbiA-like polyprenyltransferase [Anaerosporobacter mobilis]SHM90558.1 4-hydroxybenzoate polyprenyltransferase [Anaerosporobacter mobilis DSM 15930]
MVLVKIINKLKEYGKLVMFSHTIFSLSFALVSMVIAAKGLPEISTLIWILVCFMGARTGANAINRVIDAEIDARNPRTAGRQLPKGEMKKTEVIIFTAVCFLVMLFGAYKLNWICLLLSPIALFLMIIYSYCKRFTFLCHLVLGVTCACAPVGAWLAITGELSLVPLFMGAANTLWVAGFDIIYGSQDYDFDRENGLHSIPAKFGVAGALLIAKLFHIVTLLCLLVIGILVPQFGIIYYLGLFSIAGLFIAEYKIVSPTNLTNVNIASYSINQIVSIVLLVFGLADAFI